MFNAIQQYLYITAAVINISGLWLRNNIILLFILI